MPNTECDLWITDFELRITIYEFRIADYRFRISTPADATIPLTLPEPFHRIAPVAGRPVPDAGHRTPVREESP